MEVKEKKIKIKSYRIKNFHESELNLASFVPEQLVDSVAGWFASTPEIFFSMTLF